MAAHFSGWSDTFPSIALWLIRPSIVTERASDDQRLGSHDDTILVAKLSTLQGKKLTILRSNYSLASFFACNSDTRENKRHVNGHF